jgi:hypothetical protein
VREISDGEAVLKKSAVDMELWIQETRLRRIQRKKYGLNWRRRERRELRSDYISFVDFFIFNLNGLLKGIYEISRLKKFKTN